MTLTEFLLARFAEDKEDAKDALKWALTGPSMDHRWYWVHAYRPVGLKQQWNTSFIPGCPAPDRVLAECEAKRSLVQMAGEQAALVDGEWGCCHPAEAITSEIVDYDDDDDPPEPLPADCQGRGVLAAWLKPLAMPYADHPDYDKEWAL